MLYFVVRIPVVLHETSPTIITTIVYAMSVALFAFNLHLSSQGSSFLAQVIFDKLDFITNSDASELLRNLEDTFHRSLP